jgi:DNA-binding MarR family transcriptional regulator
VVIDVPEHDDGPMAGPAPEPVDWASLASDERIALMRLLVGAHARLTRLLGGELEEACGLPLSWFVGMVRLARAPGARLTMSELAVELSLTSGGTTRMVDRMAEAGLVERQHCPSDRRSVFVALTDAGARKLEDATTIHLIGLDQHLLGPLDVADRVALATALGKLGADPTACPG